ncbi:hypothetical protein E0Z10_g1863 [Xylaria hypoxylon]|uniref:Wax synthase domain-containing protein n=1 Tax=Xylaria hypoxylon TaxID=37992 RepID=A0A4Z0ZBG4_9PEZI|nr:hypothetical protein E0Z10_g1863 [Xylaria hypoxylon]
MDSYQQGPSQQLAGSALPATPDGRYQLASTDMPLSLESHELSSIIRASQDAVVGVFGPLNVSQFLLIATAMTPVILIWAPKSVIRRALYPIQLFCLAATLIAPLPPGQSQADLYNMGLQVGTIGARILDRLYLHNPEDTFLRVGVDDKGPDKGPASYGTGRKARWAFELILSGRGIGWNWRVGGVPRLNPAPTRWSFVRSRVRTTLLTFTLIHAVTLIASHILNVSDDNSPLRSPFFLRFFITTGWLTVIYGHLTFPENLVAIFFVTTGLGGRFADPQQWPPMFGDISESYSIRRCWGKFWHASLRRSTNAPGQLLLGSARPKSRLGRLSRRYAMLFLSFIVSGAIHAFGSYMVTRDSTQGISDGGAAIYFLAQPTAVLIEDAVSAALGIVDDGNPSGFRRIIGYVYVSLFWVWCFPTLKVIPLALAHGLEGNGADGPMLAAVRACLELSEALPFNPAMSAWKYGTTMLS